VSSAPEPQSAQSSLLDSVSNRPAGSIRVAVVFGGRSSEHSISCVSAGSIIRALHEGGYHVVPIGIDQQGQWSVQSSDPQLLQIHDGQLPQVTRSAEAVSPTAGDESVAATSTSLSDVDVVFPVLHGPWGEDGTIQGLLELAGVPYVGSGVFASAAAMDKSQCKRLLKAEGIGVVSWVDLNRRSWAQSTDSLIAGCESLGYPLFVKPARAGSSIGVSKAHDRDELMRAIDEAFTHDPRALVESAVEGAREIEVGVITDAFGNTSASVPAEIVVRSGHEFYDFEAKYLDDSVDLIVPAELSAEQSHAVRALACRVFEVLGCEGLARIDVFIDSAGSIHVNEVNTMPGFTSISMFPRMWAATGMDYPTLVDHLVRDALRRGTGLR